MPLQATSGAASYDAFGGGVPAVPQYIEDVFSTYLYTGTSASQTITNGIDLSTKGGLVWNKLRAGAGVNAQNKLYDTARGVNKEIYSNLTTQEGTKTDALNSFNTTGFTLGAQDINETGGTYCSWTFRKQPKFFDVVTYTGNGVGGNTISHNLGSVPACIIFKRTNSTSDWSVYHRSLSGFIVLNSTNAETGSFDSLVNNITSTSFAVQSSTRNNANGGTYVAYIFAHNAGGFGLTGTDNVISCGSFTDSTTVNLGYEPQWVLIKPSSITGNWQVIDNMRQWVGTDAASSDALGGNFLAPNLTNAEATTVYNTNITPTGFKVDGITAGTYIYIAIRRGPMKVPTLGTTVYNGVTWTGDNAARTITGIGFPLDMCFTHIRNVSGTSAQSLFFDRLRGNGSTTSAKRLRATSTAAETDYSSVGTFDRMDGFRILDGDSNINDAGVPSTYVGYFFKRAPSVFDEVCYTGTGVARTVTHNLGAVPELMIVKNRSIVSDWRAYSSSLGATQNLKPNTTDAATSSTLIWNDTTPTSSVFSVGTSAGVNGSGNNHVAYLFATCAGVSKVGSYTGNGSTQTINCGFGAGGARFVLIKRTDSTGGWYVYDTARGMTVLTDPYLFLNAADAEAATLGSVTTVSTGFALNSTILAAINVSSGSYIFLAIA
jgi:hypothetical protein